MLQQGAKHEEKRHRLPLPVKTFKIAPGDVVGGLIYVMDKPLGIEEGMIGLSIDSPGYREYLATLLSYLDHNNRTQSLPLTHLQKLQDKYNALVKYDDFNNLSNQEKDYVIDIFLHHPNIKAYLESLPGEKKMAVQTFIENNLTLVDEPLHKVVPVPFRENMKRLFSQRMHELRTKEYKNEGMGGLLLNAFKIDCKIQENEHFSRQIAKLIAGTESTHENNVFMIKQDGKLGLFHGTGPGVAKILKTTTGQKLQKNFTLPRVLFVLPPLYTLAQIGIRRIGYLLRNSTASVNKDAICETLATNIAKVRGCETQEITTIKGTYEDESPKVVTMVTWKSGCKDFSSTGKVQGNETKQKGLLVAQTEKGETLKQDKQGNLLHRKKVKSRIPGKSKHQYFVNGQPIDRKDSVAHEKAKQAYKEGLLIAENRIDGLGESLITLIQQGDRDAIGKKGQNKAFLPSENNRFKFYGIDFGKAYAKPVNPILASLNDDFTFKSPTSRIGDVYYSNYSVLYDNPLREKMKGVYLLGALKGELIDPKKEEIAAEYEKTDPAFAKKLREMNKNPNEDSKDIQLINQEIEKYEAQKANDPANAAEYQTYIDKLKQIKATSQASDQKILDVFKQRLNLLPSEIDALEIMEKLTARSASITKKDKTSVIVRNHLWVKRKDRTPWQFENGQLTSGTILAKDVSAMQSRWDRMCELLSKEREKNPALNDLVQKLSAVKFKEGVNTLGPLKKEELSLFVHYFSEERIAKVHDLKEYLNEQAKQNISRIRDHIDKPFTKTTPSDTVKQQERKDFVGQNRAKAPVENPTSSPSLLFEVIPSNNRPKEKQDRRRAYTMSDLEKMPPVPPLQTVATQDTSLKELDTYFSSEKEEKYRLHHIKPGSEIKDIKVGKYEQHNAKVMYFENPETPSVHATVIAQQSKQGVVYGTPLGATDEQFALAARETCRLAVFSANANKPIYLPENLSAHKQEIIRKAFNDAVEEAILSKRFLPENKPVLREKPPNPQPRGG